MKEALAGESERRADIRRILSDAHRSHATIELELLGAGRRDVTATIEMVREDDLIICHPIAGGATYPLTTEEEMRLCLFDRQLGRVCGLTKSLGRAKIALGASPGRSGSTPPSQRWLYGYRLTIPQQLVGEDRRRELRAEVEFTLAPEAELFTFGDQPTPVRGVVHDVSTGGMKIRTRNARGRLAVGQRAYLKVSLPEPIGSVTELVRIAHIAPGNSPEQHLIGVAFDEKLEHLGDFVQSVEDKRLRRQQRAS